MEKINKFIDNELEWALDNLDYYSDDSKNIDVMYNKGYKDALITIKAFINKQNRKVQ